MGAVHGGGAWAGPGASGVVEGGRGYPRCCRVAQKGLPYIDWDYLYSYFMTVSI